MADEAVDTRDIFAGEASVLALAVAQFADKAGFVQYPERKKDADVKYMKPPKAEPKKILPLAGFWQAVRSVQENLSIPKLKWMEDSKGYTILYGKRSDTLSSAQTSTNHRPRRPGVGRTNWTSSSS